MKAWDPGRYRIVTLVWVASVDGATGRFVGTDPTNAVVDVRAWRLSVESPPAG